MKFTHLRHLFYSIIIIAMYNSGYYTLEWEHIQKKTSDRIKSNSQILFKRRYPLIDITLKRQILLSYNKSVMAIYTHISCETELGLI